MQQLDNMIVGNVDWLSMWVPGSPGYTFIILDGAPHMILFKHVKYNCSCSVFGHIVKWCHMEVHKASALFRHNITSMG